MRKTTVLAITCSFFDHFGSSWACFHQKIGLVVWLCSDQSQPVQLLNLKASNCNCSCSCYQLGLGWVAVFFQLLQLDLTRLVRCTISEIIRSPQSEVVQHLVQLPRPKGVPTNV